MELFGFYKDKDKYYIMCDIHGIQKAIMQGHDTIICSKCYDNLVAEFRTIHP